MLMIGTSALAERLYSAWKERQDVVAPIKQETPWPTGMRGYGAMNRIRPRPVWKYLTAQEQNVWKDVAETAGRVMAEAMGALP